MKSGFFDGLRRLASLDDYLLRDIGLSREELATFQRMPLSVDMQWEADRLRLIAEKSPRSRIG